MMNGGPNTCVTCNGRRILIAKLSEWMVRALRGRGDVYMNLTGKKIAAGTAPSEIVPLLADQLVNCVLWEPAVLGMIKALQPLQQ